MDTCKHTYIRVEELLDFIVKKCSVASKEELGIRIHSLGMHISAIRVARVIESSTLKKSGELIIQKPDTRCSKQPLRKQQDECFTTSIHKEFCGKHIRFDSEDEGSDDGNNDHVPSNQVNLSSHSTESSDRVNIDDGLVVSSSQSKGPLHSLKEQLDDGFSTISRGVESLFSQFCGKHTRFDSAENSEDEGSDDNLYDEEDYNHDQVTCSVVSYSSQYGRSSDRVNSCPYPSAVEERERLGLDQLSPASGSQKHNEINESVKKKRKFENIISAISLPPNLRKRDMVEQDAQPIENSREVNKISNLDRRKVENWPPGDWRTASRYDYACTNGIKTQEPILQPSSAFQNKADDNSEGFVRQIYKLATISDNLQWGSSNCSKRDRLSTCTPDAIQAKETGRLGELAAFKYFIEKVGKSAVKWVNEHSETRLPYDIVVGENENSKEFIEVKATRNPTKDWFEMSVRQLQFAVEQGEAFSIAHVILSDNNVATVRVYNNLEKLLMKQNNQEQQDQDCKLKLVVLVLEQQKEFTIVS
ncbi:hypothetical protein M0R45_020363 [Rubus argutus]|uniref:Protein NO VEIN C-terminal domain-containing protein n=1 Tax=Rubus argutus TaxID=59490 RepID=A0AAW1X849_RUBAR